MPDTYFYQQYFAGNPIATTVWFRQYFIGFLSDIGGLIVFVLSLAAILMNSF